MFSTASGVLSLERTAEREVDGFQAWAGQCGVQPDNGFSLVCADVDGNEDIRAATATGGSQGSRVLFVPGEMILSAVRLAQEYEGYVEASLQVLEAKGMSHLSEQFLLFLKVLLEYEQGVDSPYFPWMAALPRKWNTAASMDEFCLSCLPPFIKSICLKEREQVDSFREALQVFEYLSPEGKADKELTRFAYNVVNTRSFPTDAGLQIIPVADMLNHGYPSNVALATNENGDCEVILTEDVAPGQELYLSYGEPTNPSRFLATYGFLDEPPATYCKILFSNPSQELLDIGYDPARMVFYTEDGGISQEVWDVMLFSRLERKPDLSQVKQAFYQAHMNGDEETKNGIHAQFLKDTSNALLRHLDHVIGEVFELTFKMNSYDASKHPRLPLLRKHNELVTSTFQKVRSNVAQVVADASG